MTPATFADAYTAWHGPIRAWLYNAVGDVDVAADLASEAFCRALENWAKFTPTHDQSVKAWLYTIAKNTLIDHNRRRGHRWRVEWPCIATLALSTTGMSSMLAWILRRRGRCLPNASGKRYS